MSTQFGSIDEWDGNSGSISPDQGQPLSVFRADCSPGVQAQLDAGNIPLRVSYDPDFSTGSPVAKDVQSAGLTASVQAARSAVGGRPSRKMAARAKPSSKKSKMKTKPSAKKGKSTKKSARTRRG